MSRYSTLFRLLLVGAMLTGGLFIAPARAQTGRYDVRFTLQEVACPKVRIQLQVKAHDAQSTFRLGDANFRFDYNPTQLKNPVLKKQDAFSARSASSDSTSYDAQELTFQEGATLATASLNVFYAGRKNAHLVGTDWITVATLEFDLAAADNIALTWHSDKDFPVTGMSEVVVTAADPYTFTQQAVESGNVFENLVKNNVLPVLTAKLSGDTTIASGGKATLKVAFSGTGPWSVTLSNGSSVANTLNNPALIEVSPTATTAYTITTFSRTCAATSSSGKATVTVQGGPVGPPPSASLSLQGIAETFCPGQSISLAFTTTGSFPSGTTFRAQLSDATGSNYSDVSGATTSTSPLALTLPTNRPGGVYRLRVLSSTSPAVGDTTNAFDLLVKPTATISGDTTILSGGTATLKVIFTGSAPWSVKLSDSSTVNHTSGGPRLLLVKPTKTTNYSLVRVTNACGTGTVSGSATVAVDEPVPTIALQGFTASDRCVGQTLSVAFTTTGAFDPTNAFALQLSDPSGTHFTTLATGPTSPLSATLPDSLNPAAGYRIRVLASKPANISSALSAPFRLKARPSATLTGTGSILAGQSATLSVHLKGEAPWSFTLSDSTQVGPVSDSLRQVVVQPTKTTTYSIVRVQNACGLGTVSGSAIVTVITQPGPPPGPSLSLAALATRTFCPGQSLSLPFTTTGTLPAGTTFRAQLSDATGGNFTDVPGANASASPLNLTLPTNRPAGSAYRLRVLSSNSPALGDTTESITLLVKPTATLSGTTTIQAGGTAQLTLSFSGSGPWSVKLSDSTALTNTSDNPKLLLVQPSKTTTYSLVRVQNACGLGTVSGSATITVSTQPGPPAASLSLQAIAETFCPGQLLALPFTTTGSFPAGTTFRAQLSDATGGNFSDVPGATASTSPLNLTLPTNRPGGVYRLRVLSSTSPVVGDTTNAFDLLVKPTAALAGDTTILAGGTAKLKLTFTGSAPWSVKLSDSTSVNNASDNPKLLLVQPTKTTTYSIVRVMNACGTGTVSGSATITVTTPPPPAPALSLAALATRTFCPGQSLSLPFTTTGTLPAGTTFRAQLSDATGGNFTDVPGATASASPLNLTLPTNRPAGSAYRLRVLSSTSPALGDTTESITLLVKPTAALSGTTTIQAGGTAQLTLNFSGSGPWSVKLSDSTTLSNTADNPKLLLVQPSKTTTYSLVRVQNACGLGTVSGSATITVSTQPGPPAASLSLQAIAETFCPGQVLSLPFTTTGSFPAGTTFRAQLSDATGGNFTDLPGATASTSPLNLTLPTNRPGGVYRLRVLSSTSPVVGDTTNAFDLLVKPTAALAGDTTILAGGTAKLKLTFTGSAPWSVKLSDSTSVNNASDNPKLLLVQPTKTTTYSIVRVMNACGTGTVSGSATITVTTPPPPAPALSLAALATRTFCPGQSLSLPFTTTGTLPAGTTFRAQLSDATGGNFTDVPGATASASPLNLTLPTNRPAGSAYRLRVLSSTSPALGDTTESITLLVKPTATLSGTTTIQAGGTAQLTLNFSGSGPWSVKLSDSTTVTNTSDNPKLLLLKPTKTTTYSLVRVMNACGLGIVSGTAIVTVTPPAPTLSLAALATRTFCPGQSLSLPFTTTGTLPAGTTFRAQLSDATGGNFSDVPGATAAASPLKLTLPTNRPAGSTYRLRVLSSTSPVVGDTTESITLLVKPTAALSGTTTIQAGGTAQLKLTFTGSGPWSVKLSDSTTLSNTTDNPKLLLVQPTKTTTYSLVRVQNACGTGTVSGSATITVISIPIIPTLGPPNLAKTAYCPGETVELGFSQTGDFGSSNSFKVQISTDNQKTFSDVSGAVGSKSPLSFTLPNDPSLRDFSLRVVAINPSIASALSPVLRFKRPAQAQLSGGGTIQPGQSATLNLRFSGEGPWASTLSDGTLVPFSTDSLKTIQVKPTQTTTYSISSVNGACGEGLASGRATVTVQEIAPTIALQGFTASDRCVGQTLSVAFTTTGAFDPTNAFALQLSDPSGTHFTTLATGPASPLSATLPDSLNPAAGYRIRVLASHPANISSALSAPFRLKARPSATLTGTGSILAGQSATLSVHLKGEAPWSFTLSDSTQVGPVSDSLRQVVVQPNKTTTYSIVRVQNACGTGTVSGSAIVTVTTPPPALSATLSLNAIAETFCPGQAISLAFATTGSFPAGTTFRAQLSDATGGNFSDLPGATASTSPLNLTLPTNRPAGIYRLRVLSSNSPAVGDTTNAFDLLIKPTATLSGDTTILAGGTATLKLVFTGSAPWSVKLSDSTILNHTGTGPKLLLVQPIKTTTYSLVRVQNACGLGTVSGSATITVTTPPPALAPTLSLNAIAETFCPGQTLSLAFATTGTLPAGTTFRAQLSDATGGNFTDLPDATASLSPLNLTLPTNRPAGIYRLRVLASSSPVVGDTTNAFDLLIKPTATLSGDTTILAGEAAHLKLVFTGSGPWSVRLSDSTTVSHTGDTPKFQLVLPTKTTTYSLLRVQNACGPGTVSGSATIEVEEPVPSSPGGRLTQPCGPTGQLCAPVATTKVLRK